MIQTTLKGRERQPAAHAKWNFVLVQPRRRDGEGEQIYGDGVNIVHGWRA